MNSYTILNQKLFGIRLFNSPEDIGLLLPFFYEYENVPVAATQVKAQVKAQVTSVDTEPVANCDQKMDDTPEPNCDQKMDDTPVISDYVLSPLPVASPLPAAPPKKWFDPTQRDTLFWCVFTAVFGVSDYILIGTKYANREWEEKQSAILAFQKSSSALRSTNHKITLGKVQEIMSEYMTNQSSITLLGLVGLSVHYKIQIYLVDSVKKTHLVYTPENYTQTCYIYRHEILKNKYRLALEEVSLNDSFGLESFTRPLRAVSTYKMGELEELAARFGFDTSEKLKKDVIYRKLSEYAVWL